MKNRLRELNREPYTRRLVSTVRGQMPENLPQKCGKASDIKPTDSDTVPSNYLYNFLSHGTSH